MYLCEHHLRVVMECVFRDFEGLENNAGNDTGNLITSSSLFFVGQTFSVWFRMRRNTILEGV